MCRELYLDGCNWMRLVIGNNVELPLYRFQASEPRNKIYSQKGESNFGIELPTDFS
jgi:hypothetical protein